MLPTRVIDVGPADGSEEPKLFLSRGDNGHYTTLSYCWGGPQLFTLTLGTLGDKQQRLSMSDLPVAFCDAIEVTRSLEFQYLWIDALCIVQDSEIDKASEIATMDQVYQNASVTICAANIARCSQSFLSTWIPASYPSPFQLSAIKFPCPDGAMGIIFVEDKPGYSSSKEPLNQRGWALQERLLSSRLLTFGLHQMYWQCQSAQYCEGGTVKHFKPQGMERLSHDFFQRNVHGGTSAELQHIYDRWRDIIEDYSPRKFTLSTDMLPALSGIATRFASMLNDSYCAGLWRNDLLNGLAWTAAGDKTRPSAYRAPSWSWASIDGGVCYDPRPRTSKIDLVQLTKVVSCEIQPLHPTAPFGEVQAGTIELRGVVKDFDWDGVLEFRRADGNYLGRVFPDVEEEAIDSAVDPGVGERAVFQMDCYVEEGDNAVA
jgi:Heterokaryon incompatibility protein (HET)